MSKIQGHKVAEKNSKGRSLLSKETEKYNKRGGS